MTDPAKADRSAKLRAFFAQYVAKGGHAQDPRIEAAFAAVPREPFAGPAPWSVGADYVLTPDDDPAFLYQDTLIALDAEKGINIGQPSLHARCLDALSLRAGEDVLHVGAGAGYYTAIIAQLVGPKARIYAYEIDPGLAARAATCLKSHANIEVRAQSGIAEDLPRVDVIYVSAGITQPSWTWLDALRPGGRLMFPLQSMARWGAMLRVERPRIGTVWPACFVTRAGFILCDGRQDPELSRRLADAFSGGGWEAVKSFRMDKPKTATCWFAGDDWWLSTEGAYE
ncbi:MAG TPA: rRNA adenine N-6-methyltransferase family protein [Stellaceae bacterium]|nr:rRNA adenine N-6-methyltransferase family protein [Stellaceae bacterium]